MKQHGNVASASATNNVRFETALKTRFWPTFGVVSPCLLYATVRNFSENANNTLERVKH